MVLVAAAVGLVVLLYQFPRSVVETDKLQSVGSEPDPILHSLELSETATKQISFLKGAMQGALSTDKKANFALALAHEYLAYGMLDSALIYADQIEKWEGTYSEKLADIYFIAYERLPSANKRADFAKKAGDILAHLLDKDPDNLFLKNRLAMTLVSSENPMSGINMLREVVAQDPENRQGLLNLGLLAIQSGQFEKAKTRFETLASLNPKDHESKLYLAVTMIETSKPTQARLLLEEILTTQDSIPAIKMMAQEYLSSL